MGCTVFFLNSGVCDFLFYNLIMQLYATDTFVIVANIPISILETGRELGPLGHSCRLSQKHPPSVNQVREESVPFHRRRSRRLGRRRHGRNGISRARLGRDASGNGQEAAGEPVLPEHASVCKEGSLQVTSAENIH